MGNKGEQTKSYIKETAYQLFVDRGFKEITMKDICQATGMSRGGVYRHYGSTRSLFKEIFLELVQTANGTVEEQMHQGIDARRILRQTLKVYKEEMADSGRSLSLAMYEYSQVVDAFFFTELNQRGKERWKAFIRYGMERNELKNVDPEQVTDMIIYSYQGVRMWSRIIPMQGEISEHVVKCIWEMLVENESLEV